MTKQVLLITIFLITLCTIATVAFLSDAQADTRYVREGGTGDGSSWVTASGTLQAMIDAVEVAGGGEVWVASGTYTPTVMNGGTDSRYLSFQMKNEVGIYGGFSNTGSPTWTDRDCHTHITILSGEIGNPGTKTDNCYHVFYHPESLNLDNSAILVLLGCG